MSIRPRFKKTVFSNGLTLISERHRHFKSLSIGIWVKAGTRHERRYEAGVSHFLEHMLFKGTENRTALEIAKQVDRVGGEFNAFTTREYTCFHITLLSHDSKLAADILCDVVQNSTFDAEELERERKVILQEISMVEESPEELVHDLFFELVYGRHGLGRPILGTDNSIRKMRRGDLLRFFRKHYRPDQIVISVAGNVSHDAMKRKLKPLTRSRWPGREKARASKHELGFERAPKLKEGWWWVDRPTEQVHIVWGVEGPGYTSKDRFAAYVMNVYLGGGMSSVLFQEIREKNGLAYTVYSSLNSFLDSGVVTIYAATGLNQVPLCVKLIDECVRKLKQELLSEEEVQAVKDNLKGTILQSADSVESRMSSIAKNDIFYHHSYSPEQICKMIDEVTPQDIRRVARKILRDDKKSVVALGPKPTRAVLNRLKPVKPKRL